MTATTWAYASGSALSGQFNVANPTALLANEKTLYTFFMKLFRERHIEHCSRARIASPHTCRQATKYHCPSRSLGRQVHRRTVRFQRPRPLS